MTAPRCTAKLLKAMKARLVANPAPATNKLGEWTANLIRIGRVQLALAVSEPTRLGIVIDAAPYATIPFRLQHSIFKTLLWIGVPGDLAASDAEAMAPIEIAATNSRSVLGTLNQFTFQIEGDIEYADARSAVELTQRLADTIVLKPKEIGHPADRVRAVFGLPPIEWRVGLPPGIVLH
jgi:hypothetical protein